MKPNNRILVRCIRGPQQGERYSFERRYTPISIGRGESCNLKTKEDPGVLELHAELLVREGRWWIESKDAVATVLVNEERVELWVLDEGSTFTIGRNMFAVEFPAEDSEAERTALASGSLGLHSVSQPQPVGENDATVLSKPPGYTPAPKPVGENDRTVLSKPPGYTPATTPVGENDRTVLSKPPGYTPAAKPVGEDDRTVLKKAPMPKPVGEDDKTVLSKPPGYMPVGENDKTVLKKAPAKNAESFDPFKSVINDEDKTRLSKPPVRAKVDTTPVAEFGPDDESIVAQADAQEEGSDRTNMILYGIMGIAVLAVVAVALMKAFAS